MPPHCDSLDGPVVKAARAALAAGQVDLVLPYVTADGEAEIREAFDRTLPVYESGGQAAEVAQQWFFETVVRVHRTGEHAPYTGLRPAGLDVGPAIPLAESAVATGDAEQVFQLLVGELREELEHKIEHVNRLAESRDDSLAAARRYVQATLGFEVYAHHLYQAVHASAEHDHE